ncbi:hypothetical protein cand_000220 [Cryptosporidium andersoni]|uniref:Uncharacterized protein n=1 Tax=Cryptosporidium andersoni TaxID=117008 RepID=A0A1J4MR21_9CRYT|nr:hypothetical protein cand_000220 [Cryptosporidium andersoni]
MKSSLLQLSSYKILQARLLMQTNDVLSPSSSDILKKAGKIVDQLLLQPAAKCEAPEIHPKLTYTNSSGISILNRDEDMLEKYTASAADTDSTSVFIGACQQIPTIDVIKQLASKVKSKYSDSKNELGFPNTVSLGKENYSAANGSIIKSKSEFISTPLYHICCSNMSTSRNSPSVNNSCDLIKVNDHLDKLNRRVECLNMSIDDIKKLDNTDLNIEDFSKEYKLSERPEWMCIDYQYEYTNDEYNAAILQQERIKMWVCDNAKQTYSDLSENGVSDHVPFSDLNYNLSPKVDLSNRTSTLLPTTSALSTTTSGVVSVLPYTNYKVCKKTSIKMEPTLNKYTSYMGRGMNVKFCDLSSASTDIPMKISKTKNLQYIKVGNSLRRSINVVSYVDDLRNIVYSCNLGLKGDYITHHKLMNNCKNASSQPIRMLHHRRSSKNIGIECRENSNIMIIEVDSITVPKYTLGHNHFMKNYQADYKGSSKYTQLSCRDCSWDIINYCFTQ